VGFARAYLLKAGLRERLVHTDPRPGLNLIVTIPVHNESGLERCLDSLFLSAQQTPAPEPPAAMLGVQAEVLILINASSDAPEEVLALNLSTLSATRAWIAAHPHPALTFHVWLDHSFGKKEAGVGLARKILMDEAVRRFDAVDNPRGIIASLDADAVVDANYLAALTAHFEASGADGCSVYFEHPLGSGEHSKDEPHLFETFSPEVYHAIAQYELHLRYYLNAVRFTGYPYATHTVGSSFTVRADVYCLEGGMNRRQGGEDFYFIQKVAQRGNWNACNTTRVCASPRPSGRVPFGTGPVVARLVAERLVAKRLVAKRLPSRMSPEPSDPGRYSVTAAQLHTYHPEPFRMLAGLFGEIDGLAEEQSAAPVLDSQPRVLSDFLETQDFRAALAEIRGNSASPDAFRKRFWRWFNMFRIMKFLHHAREHGYPDVEVGEAAFQMLTFITSPYNFETIDGPDISRLLIQYRGIDRYSGK